jgi:hypothetical protein
MSANNLPFAHPEGVMMNRTEWVLSDHELVRRLDQAWPDEGWRADDVDGLAAALDGFPEWAGWDGWDLATQIDELDKLLCTWEQPEEADTSQPRWNAESGFWELYNADRTEWWAYDAASVTWFDLWEQRWIPLAGASSQPFGWVTEEQAPVLADLYGEDWAQPLTWELDARWGSGWQGHPDEHKRAWLTDLVPALTESGHVSEKDDDAEQEPVDNDFMSFAEIQAMNQE